MGRGPISLHRPCSFWSVHDLQPLLAGDEVVGVKSLDWDILVAEFEMRLEEDESRDGREVFEFLGCSGGAEVKIFTLLCP